MESISALLIWLAQNYPQTASTVSVLLVLGAGFVHVFPKLPKPTSATGRYATVYRWLSLFAGNWGNAANTVANLPVGTQAGVISATGKASVGTVVVGPVALPVVPAKPPGVS